MLSVDIEAASNAGHCVDPDREMQLCAIVPGIIAMADIKAVFALNLVDRCLCLEVMSVLDPIADPRFISTPSAISVLSGDEGYMALSWLISQISSLELPCFH